jgi:glutathione S-transferase
MLRLESTRACPRTPLVRFLLEELAVPCDLVLREPGHFQARYHTAGQLLVDGDLELLGLDTILRHLARSRGGALLPPDPRSLALADRWMELVGGTAHPAIGRIAAALPAPPAPAELARVRDVLAALEAALDGRDFLLGCFSVADVGAAHLAQLSRLGVDFAPFPRVAAWSARVAARPAWGHVQKMHTPPAATAGGVS